MKIKEGAAILVMSLLLLSGQAVAAAEGTGELERLVGKYSRYAGAYGQNEFSVTLDDGRLFFQPDGGPILSSTQDGEGVFQIDNPGSPVQVTFIANDSGGFDSFELSVSGRSRTLIRTDLLELAYYAGAGEVRPNALSDAVLMGDLDSARKLIAAGVDVGEHDRRREIAGSNGRRPLNWAALTNNTDMIELLLEAGAGINLTNYRSGWTPLHHAAETGSLEAAVLLLERGADASLVSADGYTPLDVANRQGSAAVREVIEKAMPR